MASWQRTLVLYHDLETDENRVITATAESILQRGGRTQKSQTKFDRCTQANHLFSALPYTPNDCNEMQ